MELINYTLGEMLEKNVAERPDNEFLIYNDRNLRFTYSDFNTRVDNLAKALIQIGIGKGDKVGVWGTNVPDWVTLMFASARIGAILVTINTSYKLDELRYIMKKADIQTICVIEGYRNVDYIDIVYQMLPELRNTKRDNIKSKEFPMLRNVIYIGHRIFKGMYNTAELLQLGGALSDKSLEEAKAKVSCHDVVNMQFTSGTTGFPKGVMLTHHNILNNGNATGDCLNYTPDDKLLACVPLFHCFGCVLAVCAVITHGASMVMLEEFDALKVLATVQKERCTALYGVPTMFIAELTHSMFNLFDLSSLRTGIMAGALCPISTMKEVMEKMHCKDIISVYGLTESSPGMTATRHTDSAEIRSTTVGRAFPNVEVMVRNPETREEVARGEQGELCCKGFNVMKGYYNDQKATDEVIDKDGWLHSGDLGTMDEEGYVRITGRLKDMIIRGGENIYPREIENLLLRKPEIKNVEVIGLPSKLYGEHVAAFIQLHEGSNLAETDIKTFCRGKLARYKNPRYVFFIDEFPQTASGKVQKYKLRELGVKLIEESGDSVL
ncbi:MAG: AMP-binding protein [Bacteroidetes bacterium]|nr:AMP-binding protein [Bacteroidota bacterium]